MKIACIGNTNNMMFTLCRYLRDEGYDAHLFLFEDEADHFLPVADSYEDSYLAYTRQLNIGKSTLHQPARVREAGAALAGFDVFIGTDVTPALLTLLGRKLDIFVPHGSDIYAYPFEKKARPGVSMVWWLQAYYYVGKIQKTGIEQARLILFPDEYDQHFPFKKNLKISGTFRSATVPMLYVPQYKKADDNSYKKLANFELFNRIRSTHDLVIFSHARQNGCNLPPHEKIHEKGNHKLIAAFARFTQQRPDLRACLVLFEYGMDIESAKKLVAELGIADKVKWMPKMQRREILYGLRLADIGCGEFENSWLTCGVVNETLVLGKPLLHFRDDSMYTAEYAELYPILNARDENEILEQLIHFADNREKVESDFTNAADWIEKYTVSAPLAIVHEFLSETKTGAGQSGGNQRMRLRFIRLDYLLRRALHKAPGKIKRIFGRKNS